MPPQWSSRESFDMKYYNNSTRRNSTNIVSELIPSQYQEHGDHGKNPNNTMKIEIISLT